MGTRCLTYIYNENNEPIVCIYRQFDGYPSVHGMELAEFMTGRILVNGYRDKSSTKESNGMECFAASLIGHLKKGIGNIYLHPIDFNAQEEYEYKITKDKVSVLNYRRESIFYGSWEDFIEYCKDDDDC